MYWKLVFLDSSPRESPSPGVNVRSSKWTWGLPPNSSECCLSFPSEITFFIAWSVLNYRKYVSPGAKKKTKKQKQRSLKAQEGSTALGAFADLSKSVKPWFNWHQGKRRQDFGPVNTWEWPGENQRKPCRTDPQWQGEPGQSHPRAKKILAKAAGNVSFSQVRKNVLRSILSWVWD